MRLSITALITCLCFGLALTPVRAETYYVATNGLDAGRTGIGDWTNALATISNGVAKASAANGNTVLVSNGTYVLSAQISLTNGTTVRSLLGRDVTIIDGNQSGRVFSITSTGTVDGFTITNGCISSGGGGGVYMTNGATLRNCIISGNKATNTDGYGGGIWIGNSGGTVTNCVIAGNTSRGTSQYRGGGGVEINNGGLVIDCVISNNLAMRSGGGVSIQTAGILRDSTIVGNISSGVYVSGGGGVISKDTTAYVGVGMVSNCTIVGNTAFAEGGGMWLNYSGLAYNCRISNNVCLNADASSMGGGGVYLDYGSSIYNSTIASNTLLSGVGMGGGVGSGGNNAAGGVFNCTITTNYAVGPNGYGGGLSVKAGNIRNCLITRNVGVGRVDGIYIQNNSVQIIQNCTIASNGTIGVLAHATAGGYLENCIVDTSIYLYGSDCRFTNCCVVSTNSVGVPATLPGAGNMTNAPAFVNTADGDYHLTIGSPCVNAGTNETWMSGATDLEGYRRIDRMNGRVDIGCYEYMFRGTMVTVR